MNVVTKLATWRIRTPKISFLLHLFTFSLRLYRPMRVLRIWLSLLMLLNCGEMFGQRAGDTRTLVFSRADTLRGMLTPERSCYDVRFYHLDVKVDPAKQFISGSNTIFFTVDSAFSRMQIDLFKNMQIEKVTLDDGEPVPYQREFNAVFVHLPKMLAKSSSHRITVFYSGEPIVAKMPPWQGGFTWTRDSSGNPWVVVTCQGTGASLGGPTRIINQTNRIAC